MLNGIIMIWKAYNYSSNLHWKINLTFSDFFCLSIICCIFFLQILCTVKWKSWTYLNLNYTWIGARMYQGGTFPCYFINTAYLRKPDYTGRMVSIRKPRVVPKYGNVQTAQRNPARYTQNRNQRQYDKLMLKAMSNMESNRGTNIHLSRDIPGSSVPLPPTPNVPPSKHSPFVLQASNTAFQYKRNLKADFQTRRTGHSVSSSMTF